MILLTGGTGFLGQHLLPELLRLYPRERFCLLVRPTRELTSLERAKRSLLEIIPEASLEKAFERIEVLDGDISLENFGLGASEFEALSRKVSGIFHLAASTSLGQSIEDARTANVGGTQHVLELANKAHQHLETRIPFHYASTAFVAGDTERIVTPDEVGVEQHFKNAYERSKAEAEMLVRSAYPHITYRIYRPSVIVGHSVTGRTSAFNVLYIPAKFLSKGLFRAIPANPHSPFDVVPVDYVANAMAALSQKPLEAGDSFHLTAGLGRESSPLEVVECIFQALEEFSEKSLKRFKTPPFIPLEEIRSFAFSSLLAALAKVKEFEHFFTKRMDVMRHIVPFIPYMLRNPRFDASATTAALDGKLAPPPLFSTYAVTLFRYCLECDWGRTPLVSPVLVDAKSIG